MNLGIEFKNCTMNFDISPEKAITGESLVIESKFLEILQNKIIAKENYLFGVMLVKKKCLFGFLLMTRKKFFIDGRFIKKNTKNESFFRRSNKW